MNKLNYDEQTRIKMIERIVSQVETFDRDTLIQVLKDLCSIQLSAVSDEDLKVIYEDCINNKTIN